jgi:choline kinase
MNQPADHHVIIPAAGSSRRMAHLTTDRPKALLCVERRPIVTHSLDVLERRGFRRATLVVGYRRELFMETLGTRHGKLEIDYVVSEDFATTEHGWSLFVTRERWHQERRPVVFMDADNLYDPSLLDTVLHAPPGDVVLVDEGFQATEREEELVLGRDGNVDALVRGRRADFEAVAGGFVGINRFSTGFMTELYAFMEPFFAARGRMQKYERVFDALIHETATSLGYVTTGGRAWLNVNHETDYRQAGALARRMEGAK